MTLQRSVAEACYQTTPAEEDLTDCGVDANARDVISEASLVLLGDHDDLAGLAMEVRVILELCIGGGDDCNGGVPTSGGGGALEHSRSWVGGGGGDGDGDGGGGAL